MAVSFGAHHATWLPGSQGKASKRFFFEKKNQKTFAPAGAGTGIAKASSK
jgi:hypothetical protein